MARLPRPNVVREIGERREGGATYASLTRDYGFSRDKLAYILAADERRRARYATRAERVAADAEWEQRIDQADAEHAVMEPRMHRYHEAFASLPTYVRHRLAWVTERRWGERDGRWPTVEQVRQLSDAELLAFPGFGIGALSKVHAWLAAHPGPPPPPLPEWLAEE